jgi:hypothetical protein
MAYSDKVGWNNVPLASQDDCSLGRFSFFSVVTAKCPIGEFLLHRWR